MKRLLIRLGLVAGLALGYVIAAEAPSLACHWGGIGCGEPEEQPFDPQPFTALSDPRINAHSNISVGWTQEEHEQFVHKIDFHAPPEFGIHLDLPDDGDLIGAFAADTVSPITGNQTLAGDIFDDNGPDCMEPAGVFCWLATVEIEGIVREIPVQVDRNAPNGHLHLHTEVTDELITLAQTNDSSVVRLETEIFGSIDNGDFMTNPAAAGTYAGQLDLVALDDAGNALPPGEAHLPVSFVVEDPAPETVTVTPANQTLRVGNGATLSAEVLDQADEALAGATVDFTVTGPNPGLKCDDVVTGADGKASCTYTGTNGGTDTVTATATKNGDSADGTASAEWREPTTVDLSPASATPRVDDAHALTATVKDQDGQAMQGETVSFNRTGANPGSGSGTTNASGQATHTYAGANPGDDSVTASVTVIAPDEITDTATVHWIEPTTLSLAPTTATKTVHRSHTLTATVTDQDGNPMAGETVGFSRSGVNPGSGSGVTNASGEATHTYTGNAPGSDAITASVGGTPASGSAAAEWVDPSVDLTPAAATLVEDQQHVVTATVRDNGGGPMQGEVVHFSASGANAASGNRTTGADGRAEFTYTGANPGDDTIEAEVDGTGASDTASAHWNASVATTLDAEPENATRQTGGTHTVTATVKDQIDRPLAGVTVDFEVTDGPHVGTSDSDTTDANGQATFTYNGEDPGTDTIESTTGSLIDEVTVTWEQDCPPNDPDCDGIPSQDDNCAFDYNPDQLDTDGDGLGDVCDNDDDGDALLDGEEPDYGCNPKDPDTDDDGRDDKHEETFEDTECEDPDTDDDGLNDGEEYDQDTDPNDNDTDNDGLWDGPEVHTHGTDPTDADSDNDELDDGSEVNTHGTDPTDADSDNDELDDGDEVNDHETDPLDPDTDDDGLTDGEEVNETDTDPLDPDTDDDGVLDGADNCPSHSNPGQEDEDGDGVGDACEDPVEDLIQHLLDNTTGTAEDAVDQAFDEINGLIDLIFDTLPG